VFAFRGSTALAYTYGVAVTGTITITTLLFFSVTRTRWSTVPRVPADQRTVVDDLGYSDDGITLATARFGYLERLDVPGALALLDPTATEGRLRLESASYFVSKIELWDGDAPTMARWRKRLLITTSHLAADTAENFALPHDHTVVMGAQIEV
jgi:KUP system potassium uptake protein